MKAWNNAMVNATVTSCTYEVAKKRERNDLYLFSTPGFAGIVISVGVLLIIIVNLEVYKVDALREHV